MKIREVEKGDLRAMLRLYMQFHHTPMPEESEEIVGIWKDILEAKNQHVLVGIVDGRIVTSCTLVIVPNLTHSQRPFAVIENLITDEEFRRRGYGRKILDHAKELAIKDNCYKIMLITGAKDEGILNFYEDLGYNRNDKRAFIKWLF